MDAHDNVPSLLPMEAPACDGRTVLNNAVWFVDSDSYRVVFYRHEPIYRIALSDEVHLRLVAVALRQSRLVRQEEICRGFGHSVSTQARWERRYGKQGIDGLVAKKHTGRPRRLDKSQEGFVRRWFQTGHSNREMAKRLGVDEGTIRQSLKRLGLRRAPAESPVLPGMEAASGEITTGEAEVPTSESDSEGALGQATLSPAAGPATLEPHGGREITTSIKPLVRATGTADEDAADRSMDRLLARLGLLDDAVPLFASGTCVPQAGVLLAIPLLVGHGLIEAFEKVYESLRPSFYGLRTIVVTLFVASLLRIRRPEQVKEQSPADLGRILGLDRAPEVKTVRRKLSHLAAMGRGKSLMEAMARRRIAEDADRVAFLYVDGHVREYHGKFRLFGAKKSQRQVASAAATDTWVHTADGEPLLVVTSEVNAKLTQVLEPILSDVRRLVGDQRRMTVIFDRGGFSPKLFARLIASGFDLITYRKGKVRKRPSGAFSGQKELIDGVLREYRICDSPRVRVGRLPVAKGDKGPAGRGKRPSGQYLWMREVRVLREDGRQTAILTTREDLSAAMVAYRIFHRWRQENYFKYMDEEFALDALLEYGVETVSETTDRRNPVWLRLTRRIQQARAEVSRLHSELGKEAAANEESSRPTMRGFKIAHAGLREQLQHAEATVARLLDQRQKVPQRIPATDMRTLKTERKLIADTIKMAAYQVETHLLGMLQGHYARADEEGRTLLHAAFQSSGRLEVADQELRVTIAPQSSPHRTAAVAALGRQLDAMAVAFPGTTLRLRLAVEATQPVTS